jgi:hypothetical protein
MSPNFVALRERQIRNLTKFLNTELSLGTTFAHMAKYYLDRRDKSHYEASKRNAIAALEAIDHFKGQLPEDIRAELENGRSALAKLISTL